MAERRPINATTAAAATIATIPATTTSASARRLRIQERRVQALLESGNESAARLLALAVEKHHGGGIVRNNNDTPVGTCRNSGGGGDGGCDGGLLDVRVVGSVVGGGGLGDAGADAGRGHGGGGSRRQQTRITASTISTKERTSAAATGTRIITPPETTRPPPITTRTNENGENVRSSTAAPEAGILPVSSSASASDTRKIPRPPSTTSVDSRGSVLARRLAEAQEESRRRRAVLGPEAADAMDELVDAKCVLTDLEAASATDQQQQQLCTSVDYEAEDESDQNAEGAKVSLLRQERGYATPSPLSVDTDNPHLIVDSDTSMTSAMVESCSGGSGNSSAHQHSAVATPAGTAAGSAAGQRRNFLVPKKNKKKEKRPTRVSSPSGGKSNRRLSPLRFRSEPNFVSTPLERVLELAMAGGPSAPDLTAESTASASSPAVRHGAVRAAEQDDEEGPPPPPPPVDLLEQRTNGSSLSAAEELELKRLIAFTSPFRADGDGEEKCSEHSGAAAEGPSPIATRVRSTPNVGHFVPNGNCGYWGLDGAAADNDGDRGGDAAAAAAAKDEDEGPLNLTARLMDDSPVKIVDAGGGAVNSTMEDLQLEGDVREIEVGIVEDVSGLTELHRPTPARPSSSAKAAPPSSSSSSRTVRDGGGERPPSRGSTNAEKSRANDHPKAAAQQSPSFPAWCPAFILVLGVLSIAGVAVYVCVVFLGLTNRSDNAAFSTSTSEGGKEYGTSGTAGDDRSPSSSSGGGSTTDIMPTHLPTTRPTLTAVPTARPTGAPSTDAPTGRPTTVRPSVAVASPTEAEPAEVDPTESFPGYETFSFYVIGDTPYNDDEAVILRRQLDLIGSRVNDERFLVHVGDVKISGLKVTGDCDRWRYELAEDLLKDHCPMPALVLPGDNDWTECPDPDSAWEMFMDSFGEMEWRWATSPVEDFAAFPATVSRQYERKENFAFVQGGVLFLGLNLVVEYADVGEFEMRMGQNADWIQDNVARYAGMYGTGMGEGDVNAHSGHVRAIILFGHAWHREFFEDVRQVLEDTGVPIVYIHGDGHEYDALFPFGGDAFKPWKGFLQVQVDQGAIAPPLRITVQGTTEASKSVPFVAVSNDQLMYKDFIRLDRRGGTQTGPLALFSETTSDGGEWESIPMKLRITGECNEDEPCARCAGDCDRDRDCLPSLKCFSREGDEAVPGCRGDAESGRDYCS